MLFERQIDNILHFKQIAFIDFLITVLRTEIIIVLFAMQKLRK